MLHSTPGAQPSVRTLRCLRCKDETELLNSGFVPPYALQRILQALSDPAPNAKNTAYFFAVVAFFANLSFAQVDDNKL